MQINDKCSLCIATYNWPAALKQCLLSVLSQKILPCEVLIADDGSTNETKQLIVEMQKMFPIPIVHVWQNDDGFRKTIILNKTIIKAKGDYIIEIDGDVILHPNFIQDHLRFAKKNTFVAGVRCMLTNEFTNKLLTDKQKPTIKLMQKNSTKTYNGFRILPLTKLLYFFKRGRKQVNYVLGANMAYWKKDFIAINGFNEDILGWGREDNDLALRAHIYGARIRFLSFAAVVFHMHHKGEKDNRLETNDLLYKQTLANKITFAPKGVNQYI